ncbi:MAG: tetratricopeptide repeat protein [Planctomycetaceae bacterium]|nr:tetratricopeptide repeat protein [Planctomycetaceae bacterium]
MFPLSIRTRSLLMISACAVTALGGCSWYGFGDTKKDEMTQELSEHARRSEEAGDLVEATDSLAKIAKIDQADVAARLELARLHRERGQIDEAIKSLREVVSLTPDDTRAWFELGELYYEKGNYHHAEASLDASLQLDPRNIKALMIKAEIEEQRRFESQALEYYYRVLAIEENYPPALLGIARIHMRNEEPVRASILLRSVCYCRGAAPAQIAEARWLLGIAYGQEHRWEESVESLKIATEIMDPPGAEDLYYLAYAQYQAGNDLEATKTINLLLQQYPAHRPTLALAQAVKQRQTELTGEYRQVSATVSMTPPPPKGWENLRGEVRLSDRSGS